MSNLQVGIQKRRCSNYPGGEMYARFSRGTRTRTILPQLASPMNFAAHKPLKFCSTVLYIMPCISIYNCTCQHLFLRDTSLLYCALVSVSLFLALRGACTVFFDNLFRMQHAYFYGTCIHTYLLFVSLCTGISLVVNLVTRYVHVLSLFISLTLLHVTMPEEVWHWLHWVGRLAFTKNRILIVQQWDY